MKQRKPLRRTAFRRAEWKPTPREDRPMAQLTLSRALVRGTYAGAVSGVAVGKPEPYRDRVLLDMARDRPCLLLVPGCCNHRVDTTVAAHSNLSIHGKAGGRKADDCYSAWSCVACHSWLDQGKATFLQKEGAFMSGHARQVLWWRLIAADLSEPARFRKAAQMALDQLGATPAGEIA